MRVAIVDDEKHWIDRVLDELKDYQDEQGMQIDVYTSGEAYLKSKEIYEISFIDVEMEGIDGFETISRARVYNSDGIFVILTTHTEMSRIGYRVNALRYIDKMCPEEIKEAIEAALIMLERDKRITVPVIGDKKRELVLKNIIYVETERHYVLIHTKQGIIKCSNSMTEMETILEEYWFFRCHNAYIINLDEIVKMKNRRIFLSDGSDIDVAFRKFSEFKKRYMDRKFECANG